MSLNGLTRRTYTVRVQDGDDTSPFDRLTSILTYEEAEAQARVALIDWLDRYLSDNRLLAYAKDHWLIIEPMDATHGMRIAEHCNAPGDHGLASGYRGIDATRVAGSIHSNEYPHKPRSFSAWFYVTEPER